MFILTKANIATKLKISRATVYRTLRNYSNVSRKTIKAVEKGLRLSIINQDRKKIRKRTAELLMETIKNPDIKFRKNIKIEEEFIWNDSIKKTIF